LLFVAVSVIGGWYVACLVMLLPYNMQDSLDTLIRFCLSVTGNDYLANPDDMPMLALSLFWIVATLLVGALLFIGYRTVRESARERGSPR
jgi:hypothetical protein